MQKTTKDILFVYSELAGYAGRAHHGKPHQMCACTSMRGPCISEPTAAADSAGQVVSYLGSGCWDVLGVRHIPGLCVAVGVVRHILHPMLQATQHPQYYCGLLVKVYTMHLPRNHA